jgi:polysaccharide biosynthesis/export protein
MTPGRSIRRLLLVCLVMRGAIAGDVTAAASQQTPSSPPPPVAAPAAAAPHAASAPAPDQYRFGAGDSFVVRGTDIEEVGDKPFRVDSTGTVTFPLIGSVQVLGLTIAELQTALNERLMKYVKSPAVSVSLAEMQSQPVSVFGAVNASGVQQAGGAKTLVEVLSLAGGLRNDAGNMLTVTRATASGPLPLEHASLDPTGRFWIGRVDVKKLMASERPQDNIRLMANDVVSVPRAEVVYVIGDINRAGAIPLFGRMTVTQALARAEGLQKGASKRVRILREMPGSDKPQEIAVDFKKVLAGAEQDHELHPNDIVIIPTNMSRSTALRIAAIAASIGTRGLVWGF